MADTPKKDIPPEAKLAAIMLGEALSGHILTLPITYETARRALHRPEEAPYHKAMLADIPLRTPDMGLGAAPSTNTRISQDAIKYLAEHYDIIVIKDRHTQLGIRQFAASHLDAFHAGGGTHYGIENTPAEWKESKETREILADPTAPFLKFLTQDTFLSDDLITRLEKAKLVVVPYDHKSPEVVAFMTQMRADGFDIYRGFPRQDGETQANADKRTRVYQEKHASEFNALRVERQRVTATHWVPTLKAVFDQDPHAKVMLLAGGAHINNNYMADTAHIYNKDLDELLQEATGKKVVVLELEDATFLQKTNEKIRKNKPGSMLLTAQKWNSNFLFVVDKSYMKPEAGAMDLPEIRGMVPFDGVQRAISCPDFTRLPAIERSEIGEFCTQFSASEDDLVKLARKLTDTAHKNLSPAFFAQAVEIANGLTVMHHECSFGHFADAQKIGKEVTKKKEKLEEQAAKLPKEQQDAVVEMTKIAGRYSAFVDHGVELIKKGDSERAQAPQPPILAPSLPLVRPAPDSDIPRR
jgi:hypothetical protein